MKSALDVHRELLARDVPHEMVRLSSAVVTADDLPRVLGLDPDRCLAVRCYLADDRFIAVLLAAGAVPDPVALLDATGAASVRPATAEQINAATDYAARLVSPVALPAGVDLLADSSLVGEQVVYAPAGEGGVALGIRPEDLLAATGARTAALTPRPQPAADALRWAEQPVVLDLDAPTPAPPRPRRG